MNAIKDMLQFINNNWTMIIVAIAVIVYVVLRIKRHFADKDNKDFAIAKAQVAEVILKMVAGAEEDYNAIKSAGAIKRAQVINQVFDNYPILSRITDQESVINWIDTLIDNALAQLRRIVEINKESTKEDVNR